MWELTQCAELAGLSHQLLSHLAFPLETGRPEEMWTECPDGSLGRTGHVPPCTGQGRELLVQLWRNVGTQVEALRGARRAGFSSLMFISVLNVSRVMEQGLL